MAAPFTVGGTEVGSLTIENGAILAPSFAATNVFDVKAGSTLTISNVEITATTLSTGVLVKTEGTVKLDVDAILSNSVSIIDIAKNTANVTLNGKYVAGNIVKYETTASDLRGNGATLYLDGEFELDYGVQVNHGLKVNIDGGKITADGTVVSFVDGGKGGIVNINGGTLTSKKGTTVSDGAGYNNQINITSDNAKLVSESKIATDYALKLNNYNTKLTISGGYFESAGDKAAVYIRNYDEAGFLIPSTEEDLAKVKTNLYSVITGGHFLNEITDDVKNNHAGTTVVKANSAVEYMVDDDYVVTEEGDYKVVSLAKAPADEPTVDEPVVDPSDDGEPAGDETEGKVPSTFDGIASIVTMAISSVSAAGYSIKKIIRK